MSLSPVSGSNPQHHTPPPPSTQHDTEHAEVAATKAREAATARQAKESAEHKPATSGIDTKA